MEVLGKGRAVFFQNMCHFKTLFNVSAFLRVPKHSLLETCPIDIPEAYGLLKMAAVQIYSESKIVIHHKLSNWPHWFQWGNFYIPVESKYRPRLLPFCNHLYTTF